MAGTKQKVRERIVCVRPRTRDCSALVSLWWFIFSWSNWSRRRFRSARTDSSSLRCFANIRSSASLSVMMPSASAFCFSAASLRAESSVVRPRISLCLRGEGKRKSTH